MTCPICSHKVPVEAGGGSSQGAFECGQCGAQWGMASGMDCPGCRSGTRVEINMKADGFGRSMFECGHCGVLWTMEGDMNVIISRAAPAGI